MGSMGLDCSDNSPMTILLGRIKQDVKIMILYYFLITAHHHRNSLSYTVTESR